MRVHGQKIERHVARHQLYVHGGGGHTGVMWMRVKGWWILRDEDKLRACRFENRTKTPKNGGRRRKKGCKVLGDVQKKI